MLGNDLILPGSLVRDPRLDYVALGHIHKSQNLNENHHPPVIYPGSIERVDFGEAADDKFYVIARVERGHTEVEWRKLNGRRFIDRKANLAKISEDGMPNADELLTAMLDALPKRDQLRDAIAPCWTHCQSVISCGMRSSASPSSTRATGNPLSMSLRCASILRKLLIST